MGPTPVYGARAEKPLQNADFAMKQKTYMSPSGDINEGTNEQTNIGVGDGGRGARALPPKNIFRAIINLLCKIRAFLAKIV